MIKYRLPDRWLRYDRDTVSRALVEAKAAVDTLKMLPYQREWVEQLQQVQLKREIAGTSRIEGAEFSERELDEALRENPAALLTRSQRQAGAAVQAYRWIAQIPGDRPIDENLIKHVHSLIVKGADDDHCPPGVLRGSDQNVTFGSPLHRGAEGGSETNTAFQRLIEMINGEALAHDPLVQALGFHYHFAAIHPFLDGNGRTARALEALILGRAGLRDVCFIAMSNYYYDEKPNYLRTLSEVRAADFDLTVFLVFGLKGIKLQSQVVIGEIRTHISRALFQNVMYDLFTRLRSPKKRVIVKRQLEILKQLLTVDSMLLSDLHRRIDPMYGDRKNPWKAFIRDVRGLIQLQAIRAQLVKDTEDYRLSVDLDWPTQITESEFFRRIRSFPKSKAYKFLS